MAFYSALIRSQKQRGIVRAFRHRDFAVYSAGNAVSSIGMWVQRVAIGWLTWELTQSPGWLGGIALAQALPGLLLLPVTGAVTDRMDRLKLMRVTQLISFVLSAILAWLVITNLITIEILAVMAALTGASSSFSVPARMSMSPSLVPREDLSAAIAVGSVVFNSSTLLGPAVAGLLITKIGIGWAFVFNAASFLGQYATILMIRNFRHEHHGGKGQGIGSDIAEGLRYVWKHGGILPVLLLAFISSLLIRPLMDLLPGFAGDVLNADAASLSTLFSAFGAGGIVGSLWMANRNRREGTTGIFLYGTLAMTVITTLFAFTTHFTLAIAFMVAFGLVASATMNAAQVLVQGSVDGAMRARVMSLYSLNFRAGPSIGAMLIGGIAEIYGLPFPVAGAAILCFLVALVMIPRKRAMADSLEGSPAKAC